MKKKKAAPPNRIRIRKNDAVIVITGRDKGKRGRVLEVIPSTGRVLVEGVQLIKRHTKPNPGKQIKGGIAEKEAPIHVSNVMLETSAGKTTRIGVTIDGESRTRIARRTGESLDKK
jgi:large subunit ribosomal protein L24